MIADPFARWMALAFPWITPEGTDWPKLRAAWDAGRHGKEHPRPDPGTRAAWRAGFDAAQSVTQDAKRDTIPDHMADGCHADSAGTE